MSDLQPILSLTQVGKSYKQGRSYLQILDNINLKLFPGQTIAIIGASGSGKSTLLHIAGLLENASCGTVSVDNNQFQASQNLGNLAAQIRLNKIGFVYQYHHLLKNFTAQENIAMPLLIIGVDKRAAMEKAEEMLNNLGLGKRLCHLPGELSGGEQQRVAIGRALINHPKLILADEPTGNLDPDTAQEIFAMLLERAKHQQAAIMMVSHNIELATKMDLIYELQHHRLTSSKPQIFYP